MRTNERAAAALGISVFGVKLYAFGLAAAIAGIGGVVLAFRTTTVGVHGLHPARLDPGGRVHGDRRRRLRPRRPVRRRSSPQGSFGTWLLEVVLVVGPCSCSAVLFTVIGLNGVAPGRHGRTRRLDAAEGDLLDPRDGVPLAIGILLLVVSLGKAPGAGWGNDVFNDPNPSWLVVIGGITVIALVVLHPDGAISVNAELYHRSRDSSIVVRDAAKAVGAASRRRRASPSRRPPSRSRTSPFASAASSPSNDASVTVEPGQIVGLIGPNGAGKTTLIDAITGFVKPAAGEVVLNGQPIGGWPVYKRARAGVSRSFQQLELFESATVRENLAVASDGYSAAAVPASDLVMPTNPPLSSTATAAVKILELEQYLDTRVSDLPYGRRRLVAIARAIAVSPSVLLLDEPAAGLSATETAELGTVVRRLAARSGVSRCSSSSTTCRS